MGQRRSFTAQSPGDRWTRDGELSPPHKDQEPALQRADRQDKRNGEDLYGEFLFIRILERRSGFFADDEWVADVICPDCEKSL